ncbi:malonate decarboxylase holo-[acyl-carrier-protein] synthase [Legionella oakridgensis]|uniref:Malonate decarboxylase holo-[acyl-carrier-protein] synthase n=2 Tax=Legionella oakridgensis TaxID=29423 RepID=W0BG36_9GAMM|nr:malonate decarboxylase holo-[acyl-carrier-protein] synthase [Legionella oakridgensis]AHE67592.1 malonate decarboxylase holo-[acyl-carrier-protein] synthase [Legionella oakridgensis ATCC 33761 = DSM 21215]ETO92832.1 malonate decarboxylase holo-[acyl-carrier-protein] synthase [Legionella oakridgensis RV-2-2007]KTD37061.1 nucleotidyltransferase [Legionella oakridgensis]STY20630.1 nucleotidyltransferase [Legionella longbeachae]
MIHLRHHLCYLKNSAILLDGKETTFFEQWVARGFPLICTRQPNQLSPAQIQLAIPYVDCMTQRKYRFSFKIAKKDIATIVELPTIEEVFPNRLFKQISAIQVFGSYCWQYLTGHPYVHSASDLDLLISYEQQSLQELSDCLAYLKALLKIQHMDGEVRFKQFGDCALLELLDRKTHDILFKTWQDVTLVSRDVLYANFPTLSA